MMLSLILHVYVYTVSMLNLRKKTDKDKHRTKGILYFVEVLGTLVSYEHGAVNTSKV